MLLFYLQVFANFSINCFAQERCLGFFWCFLSFLVIRLKFFFFLLFFVASRGRFFHVDVNAVLFFSFFLLIFFSLNAYG